MNLDRLTTDLREAQLARDVTRVSTLRMVLSELHNAEIQKGSELGEQEIIAALQKEAKKRKEAAEAFRSGDREESAKAEEAELRVIESYLPAQMSDEELTGIVERSITEIGAKEISDMGKVMTRVMAETAGRADGGRVSILVKEKLND